MSKRCKHIHGAMEMFFMKHTSYSFNIASKNTQNLRYYETIVQLLYLSGNHMLMICTKINGHTENIKIYWYTKYQYIEKKVSWWTQANNNHTLFISSIKT
jgi:hypothetical protein